MRNCRSTNHIWFLFTCCTVQTIFANELPVRMSQFTVCSLTMFDAVSITFKCIWNFPKNYRFGFQTMIFLVILIIGVNVTTDLSLIHKRISQQCTVQLTLFAVNWSDWDPNTEWVCRRLSAMALCCICTVTGVYTYIYTSTLSCLYSRSRSCRLRSLMLNEIAFYRTLLRFRAGTAKLANCANERLR